MDKINKALLKIPDKQRKAILAAAKQVQAGKLDNLDIKKLKGSSDLFRVRVGNYRLIILIQADRKSVVVDIAKRDDRTYRDY